MKTFKDLEFKVHPGRELIGHQARMNFDNGFGVSVIKGLYTYGGDMGLYELAVFKDGEIHYDNPVANGDVCGYLSESDVDDLMFQVQNL